MNNYYWSLSIHTSILFGSIEMQVPLISRSSLGAHHHLWGNWVVKCLVVIPHWVVLERGCDFWRRLLMEHDLACPLAGVGTRVLEALASWVCLHILMLPMKEFSLSHVFVHFLVPLQASRRGVAILVPLFKVGSHHCFVQSQNNFFIYVFQGSMHF